MNVKACICTDAGPCRRINQDAALVKVANSKNLGRIALIAVCDGMGGLSKGEVASCKVIRALETWFHEELVLMTGMSREKFWETVEISWNRMLARVNGEIRRYGKHRSINLGTTFAALLQVGRQYMFMNIGDSRIYFTKGQEAVQLTKDQSLAQRLIDTGEVTDPEDIDEDKRSVLLQCVGTHSLPEPQVGKGAFDTNTTVIACTDGLWRTITGKELYAKLCPQMCLTDEDMMDQGRKLIDLAMTRDEQDNISIAAMCLEF
ncbi:PP2C family protein-serine/threonine phosphatase [Butyrivibrio sp. MC2021]|uniref:PP2C family protein-serine/threonine phosphatase n=1 Tax=Butyrivibrio sp. MC2021 TaxID=1408306 RepID=UPI00047AC3C3|nr:PP2C family serine/threonine-protein phosphatase [Butyrivibrio sp. MC2021]